MNPDVERVVREHPVETFTAVVKAYAQQVEQAGMAEPPVDAQALTATEVVVAASELIRAANLNLFDVAMWYRRPTGAGRG
ncbi:MAG TPA: hypothetical protein VEA40_23885 [Ramlibacter sp.]|nr:hypothetical protein [Ramlibacter sp.]